MSSELVGIEPPKCDCGSFKAMNYDVVAWNHQGNV